MSEPFKKKCVDVYNDLSYHLLASFGWIIYHGVEGSYFNVVYGTDLTTSHMWRGYDEVKLERSSVLVVSRAVLMRRYQFLVP